MTTTVFSVTNLPVGIVVLSNHSAFSYSPLVCGFKEVDADALRGGDNPWIDLSLPASV